MPDVMCALVRHEEAEGRRHQSADVLERARPDRSYERLQFGKGEFDGIEVRTVGRKKSEERARLCDRRAHFRLFMGGQIVEHNDIARSQRRHQDLLDVSAERSVVDRSIEHGRGRQRCWPECRDHGVRLPVAARRVIRDAGAARAARVATEQIRRDARFIHEDVLTSIVERQRLTPLPPGGCDVRSTLFVGVYRFF